MTWRSTTTDPDGRSETPTWCFLDRKMPKTPSTSLMVSEQQVLRSRSRLTTDETPLWTCPSDSDPETDPCLPAEIDPTEVTERTDLHDEVAEVDEDEADAREEEEHQHHRPVESPRRKRLSRSLMPSSTVICRISFLHTCNILIMMELMRGLGGGVDMGERLLVGVLYFKPWRFRTLVLRLKV